MRRFSARFAAGAGPPRACGAEGGGEAPAAARRPDAARRCALGPGRVSPRRRPRQRRNAARSGPRPPCPQAAPARPGCARPRSGASDDRARCLAGPSSPTRPGSRRSRRCYPATSTPHAGRIPASSAPSADGLGLPPTEGRRRGTARHRACVPPHRRPRVWPPLPGPPPHPVPSRGGPGAPGTEMFAPAGRLRGRLPRSPT